MLVSTIGSLDEKPQIQKAQRVRESGLFKDVQNLKRVVELHVKYVVRLRWCGYPILHKLTKKLVLGRPSSTLIFCMQSYMRKGCS